MNLIFAGLIFVLMDINNQFGTITINLLPSFDILPDFLGYLLIALGLRTTADKSICFKKVRPYIRAAGVYTLLLYALDFLEITDRLGALGLFAHLIATILTLYTTYLIGLGLNDLEDARFCVLRAYAVYEAWRALMISRVAAYAYQLLVIYPPHLPEVFVLEFALISTLCTLYFLFRFGQARHRYYRFIR